MNRLFPLVGGLMALAVAGSVAAHEGQEPLLIVPADHVMPGEAFTVVADDFEPDVAIEIELLQDDRTVNVGSVTTDEAGHFTTDFVVPPDFPHGYAQLVANASDGAKVGTLILVGPRDAAGGSPPVEAGEWWSDPAVIVLGLLLSGTLLAVGMVLLRPRTQSRQGQPSRSRALQRGADKRARRVP